VANLQSVHDDVAQALEPSLDELQQRLDERARHPLANALRDECRQIRTALASWPQLVSAHVARQLWARIDTIRRLLDVIDESATAPDGEPGGAVRPTPASRMERAGLGLVVRAPDRLQPVAPFRASERDADSADDEREPSGTAPRSAPRRRSARPVALLPARVVRPISTEPYRVEGASPADPRLAVLSDPHGPVAEAYRSLFFRIRARSAARSWMVTTVAAGEESSTCAANLALVVAEAIHEPVLLIEARVDQPSLARLFGVEPQECFGRRLAQHLRQPDAPWPVARLGQSDLHLLTVAEGDPARPPLDVSALEDVVTRLSAHRFAYVIVDAPPTTSTSDARYLVRCAQGVVVALHAGVTHNEAIRRARQLLNGTPVLGYVLIEH
jgi:protein-tyrosine kinase